MSANKIFVGRKAELEQFKEVLGDPKGQAVLVVGQAGMGKSWLINKMVEIAENHPDLKCGWVRYEVTPTDSPDSIMALMMDNAYEASRSVKEGIKVTGRNKEMWKALVSVVEVIGGTRGKALAELVLSFQRDKTANTRTQFLDTLNVLSKRLGKVGRAVFIIDPEKYMQKESDQSWAIVVNDLPEKIKFVFAQRTEDVLVGSEVIDGLDNIVQIPGEKLDVLSEEDVDELVKCRKAKLPVSIAELRKVLKRYKGHPYAVGAALDLVEQGTKLEELPERPEPTKFAEVQWKELSKKSKDAICLFKGYAILEVGVPDDVVESVSEIDSDTRQHLLADKFLSGLLREEGEGRRIYHAILADYIVGQIGEAEKKEYHARAVGVYREKLAKAKKEQTRPDALAATRLAEHVLEAEGKEAFVETCAYETFGSMNMLGLLDAALGLAKRALDMVRKGSKEEAAVRCTMGLVYRTKGDLDEAEKMHLMALEIEKEGQREQGIAREYGNLGLIYRQRGDLDKAEEMHKKSLEIDEKMGNKKGIASDYGNLGLIYETKGELDKAEEMHLKALEIDEKMGNQEGIAIGYGNLGLIYYKRGDLDKAEQMHRKALELNEKLGRLEGIAKQYGNLGVIYKQRGDLNKAEEMYRDGLKIDEKLGRLEGMAAKYGNLGNIFFVKGDLDKAEEMYLKSLEIDKKLGRQGGMAIQYGNLGVVYEKQGDVGKAKEYWQKALDLYKKIGIQPEVEKVERWIDEAS